MEKIAEVTGMFDVPVSVTKEEKGYWIHIHYGDDGDIDPSIRIDHDVFIEFIKEICRKERIKCQ